MWTKEQVEKERQERKKFIENMCQNWYECHNKVRYQLTRENGSYKYCHDDFMLILATYPKGKVGIVEVIA